MKARGLDQKFDAGEDITKYLEVGYALDGTYPKVLYFRDRPLGRF